MASSSMHQSIKGVLFHLHCESVVGSVCSYSQVKARMGPHMGLAEAKKGTFTHQRGGSASLSEARHRNLNKFLNFLMFHIERGSLFTV